MTISYEFNTFNYKPQMIVGLICEEKVPFGNVLKDSEGSDEEIETENDNNIQPIIFSSATFLSLCKSTFKAESASSIKIDDTSENTTQSYIDFKYEESLSLVKSEKNKELSEDTYMIANDDKTGIKVYESSTHDLENAPSKENFDNIFQSSLLKNLPTSNSISGGEELYLEYISSDSKTLLKNNSITENKNNSTFSSYNISDDKCGNQPSNEKVDDLSQLFNFKTSSDSSSDNEELFSLAAKIGIKSISKVNSTLVNEAFPSLSSRDTLKNEASKEKLDPFSQFSFLKKICTSDSSSENEELSLFGSNVNTNEPSKKNYTESHESIINAASNHSNTNIFKSIEYKETPVEKIHPPISNPLLTSIISSTRAPDISFKKDVNKCLENFNKPVGLTHKSEKNPNSNFPIREDIIIQYCRQSPLGVCSQFSALPVNYNKPLIPWYCPHHRSNVFTSCSIPNLSEANNPKQAPFKPIQQSKDSFIPQKINTNPKKSTQPETNKPINSGLKSSIWNLDNVRTTSKRVFDSNFKKVTKEPVSKIPVPPKVMNFYSSPLYFPSEPSNDIVLPAFTPYASVPEEAWDYDFDGRVFIYSARISSKKSFGTYFYNIGGRLSLDSSELYNCSILNNISEQNSNTELTLLGSVSTSRIKLLSWYLHEELLNNFFNSVTSIKKECKFCKGSHKEWYVLSEENHNRLIKKIEMSGDQHIGWSYIEALIKSINVFITETYS